MSKTVNTQKLVQDIKEFCTQFAAKNQKFTAHDVAVALRNSDGYAATSDPNNPRDNFPGMIVFDDVVRAVVISFMNEHERELGYTSRVASPSELDSGNYYEAFHLIYVPKEDDKSLFLLPDDESRIPSHSTMISWFAYSETDKRLTVCFRKADGTDGAVYVYMGVDVSMALVMMRINSRQLANSGDSLGKWFGENIKSRCNFKKIA